MSTLARRLIAENKKTKATRPASDIEMNIYL